MTDWHRRLKQAMYTASDGRFITFDYEDVQEVTPVKAHAHDFRGADGTYVERKGLRGKRYPLRIIFWGNDHDLQAKNFDGLLAQPGRGILQHPMYGRNHVVPFGNLTRNDMLKTAANQTVYEITFYKSILSLYPAANQVVTSTIDAVIAGTALQDQFAGSVDTTGPAERASFLATMKGLVAGVKKGLRFAQDTTNRVQNEMNRIETAITNALTLGVATPLSIASQLKILAMAPARSLERLQDRLEAYKGLAKLIFSGQGTGSGGGVRSGSRGTGIVDPGSISPAVDSRAANTFHANNFVAQLMVLGSASAVASQQFSNRVEALEAIDELTELLADQVDWSEANFAALSESTPFIDPRRGVATGPGVVDTGGAAQMLQTVVGLTVQRVMEDSYNLPPQRSVIIDRDRTILDLCMELYRSEDALDSFILQNDFSGDEIRIAIPRGREVVYYV